jgi:hypothetical protein
VTPLLDSFVRTEALEPGTTEWWMPTEISASKSTLVREEPEIVIDGERGRISFDLARLRVHRKLVRA